MDMDMDTSPSYFDPEVLSVRDQFCCYRYGSDIRHQVVKDKLMRQKAQLLLGEAAS